MTKAKDVNDAAREGTFDPDATRRMEDPDAAQPSAPFAVPRSYTLEDLEEDRRRELLSLAELPHGHGWGEKLERLTGYGLAPGDVVALGAAAAGAGKTSLIMQLADGLALRSAELVERGTPGPLTPTVMLSEMAPRALAQRTLGRLVRAPAWYFRSGVAAARAHPPHPQEAAGAYEKARQVLAPGGLFQQLPAWQRVARPSFGGRAVLDVLALEVDTMRAEVVARFPGREVWPVVVIDPIQRWQDGTVSEVEALNALAERLDQLADENGWIVLLTSDTNKAAAVGKEEKDRDPAALFRGSYKLFHSCDLVLSMEAEAFDAAKITRRVTVKIAKSRNSAPGGVAYLQWNGATGWFREEVDTDRVEAPAERSKPSGRDAASNGWGNDDA